MSFKNPKILSKREENLQIQMTELQYLKTLFFSHLLTCMLENDFYC